MKQRHYKCYHCRKIKPANEFYTSKNGRATPHCISCNSESVLFRRYTTQIRREGSTAFRERIEKKESQLALMHKALETQI